MATAVASKHSRNYGPLTIAPEQAQSIVERWREEPEDFLRNILNADPWDVQVDILHSVRDNPRTAVRSCNAIGKDWLAARIALWWLTVWEESAVITTAPSWHQVKDVTWREISSAWFQAKFPISDSPPNKTELNLGPKRFAVGLSCFSEDTELLTIEGWKRGIDVKVGELVATLNRSTGAIEFQPVKDRVVKPPEEMYHLTSEKLDILVTGDHKLWAQKSRSTVSGVPWRWWSAREIWECCQRGGVNDVFRIPVAGCYEGIRDHTPDVALAEVAGWYMCEGNCSRKMPNITQVDPEKSTYIETSLERAGFSVTARTYVQEGHELRGANGRVYTTCDTSRNVYYLRRNEVRDRLETLISLKEKQCSTQLLHLLPEERHAFIEACIDGDGFRQRTADYFTQKDFERISFLQALCTLDGRATTLHKYDDCYRLSISRRDTPTRMLTKAEKVPPCGDVWCVSVDNHTLVTRRNGHVAIVGNTDVPERFQGIHNAHILVIVTEASAVPDNILNAIETLCAAGDSRILYISNPTQREGAFYNAFEGPTKSSWQHFHVPAWITPNFTAGRVVRPYLILPRWVEEMRVKWGEDSPLWQIFIEANFPDEDSTHLFPPSLLAASVDRELPISHVWSLGVDVARRGVNRTAFTIMNGGRIVEQFEIGGAPTTETAEQSVEVFDRYEGNLNIAVDDAGVGGGVVDILTDLGYDVVPVIFGSSANDAKRFANRGSELYWGLREMFQRGEISIPKELPTKDRLFGQLAKVTYEQEEKKDRIIVHKVPKTEKSKNIDSDSPDLADSLVIATAAGDSLEHADYFMA